MLQQALLAQLINEQVNPYARAQRTVNNAFPAPPAAPQAPAGPYGVNAALNMVNTNPNTLDRVATGQATKAIDAAKPKRNTKPVINSGQGNLMLGIAALARLLGASHEDVMNGGMAYMGGLQNQRAQDDQAAAQDAQAEYQKGMLRANATGKAADRLRDSQAQAKADERAKQNLIFQVGQQNVGRMEQLSDRNKANERQDALIADERKYNEGQQKAAEATRNKDNAFNMLRDPNTPYFLLPGIIEQYKANGGKLDDPATRALLVEAQKRYKQEGQMRDAAFKTALMDPKFKELQLRESTLRMQELERQLKLQPEIDGLDKELKQMQVNAYKAEQDYNKAIRSGSANPGVSIEKAMSATDGIIASLNRQRESIVKQAEGLDGDAKTAAMAKITAIDAKLNQYQANMEGYLKVLTTPQQQPLGPYGSGGGATGGIPFAPTGPDNGIKPVRRVVTIGNSNVKLGVPYKWGGTNRDCGVDCSGLTQGVYRENGLRIPRTAIAQWKDHSTMPVKTPQVGDLVFFDTGVNRTKDRYDKGTGHYVTHVGIYLGDGMVLQSGSKLGTSAVPLRSFKTIVGYKRPIV